ncbi:serine hydrolase domain-containing protein [Brevibacillus sp. B_LB10_24]|uniref:serine hydrolase domain-containing protein n=1 Tax=Brevibacillus sp. B_LB10_24 TaxID=3380645 RepID=UPI0038BC03E7
MMTKREGTHHFDQIGRQIASNLEQGIQDGIFPGGICSLTVGSRPPIIVARGHTSTGQQSRPVDVDTIYDVASLTKVVVTLPLVLHAVQQGRLSLNDPVVKHLPELEAGPDVDAKRKITLFHLLTHTSGLPAWRPYFLEGSGRAAYLSLIAAEALDGTPGGQVVYSDLGFMLLGFTLERVWDEELDQLAQRLLFSPMGMSMTAYKPLEALAEHAQRIAAAEEGNGYERNMAIRFLTERTDQRCLAMRKREASFPWRQGTICGTVHDCNAHYGLAGVSGHAGLFSTIADLERYMKIWSAETAPFSINPVLRQFAARTHTGGCSPIQRALGWEASPTGGTLEEVVAGCSGGDLVSPAAFGHTGFTGTSIWHDPLRQATLITLTNRVHPTVSPEILQWRRAHHNRIFALIMPCR